jgi:hypothetical protein
MIIDLILDRKNGHEYNAREFYYDVREYESTFNFNRGISRAMDGGTEQDVKKALCDYVINQRYNTEICTYINSVNWLY